MKTFKKANLISIFLAIGLSCFPQPVYAGARQILSNGKIRITDGVNTATLNSQGHINITQNNQTLALNRYLADFHGHNTTLSVAASAGDTSISIQGANYASFALEDRLFLSAGGPIEENHFPIITAKPGSPVLTLNKPLDFSYPIGSVVKHVVINAATQIGTLANPISYKLQPPPGVTFNVTGAVVTFQMESAGDNSKLGDIAGGVTNGAVSRARINGQIRTRSAYRTNLDLADDTSEPLNYHDKAGSGDFGLEGTFIFKEFGAYISLNGSGLGGGDYFEILIQDDLTDLVSVRLKVHGFVTINPN